MKQRNHNIYKRISAKNSDDSDEETELFIKNSPRTYEVPVIEKLIEEGDTLQSLSIKHNCTIGALKRLNNIHKENEIFAKRTIKVPHRPFSDALASVHVSGASSPDQNLGLRKAVDSQTLTATLLDLPSTSAEDVNKIIFNSHVEPSRSCDSNNSDGEGFEEEVELLPQRREVKDVPVAISKLSCSGVDGDIPWVALIVCIVILIFAIPMIYVFYIYEHPQMYHHGKNST